MKQSGAVGSLLLIYIFWGFNWAVMRLAAEYFSPLIFVVFRFSLGAAILLVICAVRGELIPPRQYWKWIILTGVLSIAGNSLLVQFCMKTLGAGLSAVLNYMQSIFVCILAAIFLKEPFTVRKGAGILLSAAGLFILMNVNTGGHVGMMLLCVLGAALWGMSSVIIKAKLTGCDTIQYSAWQMVVGVVLLSVVSLFHPPEMVVFTPLSIAAIIYNGAIASAAAFILYNRLITRMDVGKISIAIMAVPGVGVLSGILFFHEPMTPQIALGMAVLIGGILLVLWKGREDDN